MLAGRFAINSECGDNSGQSSQARRDEHDEPVAGDETAYSRGLDLLLDLAG